MHRSGLTLAALALVLGGCGGETREPPAPGTEVLTRFVVLDTAGEPVSGTEVNVSGGALGGHVAEGVTDESGALDLVLTARPGSFTATALSGNWFIADPFRVGDPEVEIRERATADVRFRLTDSEGEPFPAGQVSVAVGARHGLGVVTPRATLHRVGGEGMLTLAVPLPGFIRFERAQRVPTSLQGEYDVVDPFAERWIGSVNVSEEMPGIVGVVMGSLPEHPVTVRLETPEGQPIAFTEFQLDGSDRVFTTDASGEGVVEITSASTVHRDGSLGEGTTVVRPGDDRTLTSVFPQRENRGEVRIALPHSSLWRNNHPPEALYLFGPEVSGERLREMVGIPWHRCQLDADPPNPEFERVMPPAVLWDPFRNQFTAQPVSLPEEFEIVVVRRGGPSLSRGWMRRENIQDGRISPGLLQSVSTASVTGVVRDTQGDPVEGVTVRLAEAGHAHPVDAIGWQTTTDDEGWYVLRNLPPGRWTLSVEEQFHWEERQSVVVFPGHNETDLTVPAPHTQRVRLNVRDGRGRPAAGHPVTVYGELIHSTPEAVTHEEYPYLGPLAQLVTGDDGAVEATVRRRSDIEVSSNVYPPPPSSVRLANVEWDISAAEGAAEQTLDFSAWPILEGSLALGGEPLKNWPISLSQVREASSEFHVYLIALTEEDGSFRVEHPPGVYEFAVGGLTPIEQLVTRPLDLRDSTRLDIDLAHSTRSD